MAPRSGSRRVDHGSPLVDLDVVFADDLLVDAVADGSVGVTDKSGQYPSWQRNACPAGDPVLALFRTWRDELTAVPLPPPPDVRHALPGLEANGAVPGKRSLRSALAVAAAIAALLVGTATVGSRHASPDSALWAVTEVLWPDRAESVASRHHVEDALQQAQNALANGQTQQAQLALLRAAVELGKVDDVDGRVDMQAQVDELWRAAAPQELSTSSLAPYLLADGPGTDVPSALSTSRPDTPARDGRSTFSATASEATSNRAEVATPGAGGATPPVEPTLLLALPEIPANQAPVDPAPVNPPPVQSDPAQPTNPAGGQGAAPPAAPAVPSGQVAAPPPETTAPPVQEPPPSEQSPVPAPAAPPVAEPPLASDPGSVPSTSPALTPPPPDGTASSAPSSPEPVTSAAPPAPAPMPTGNQPGGTEPGGNQPGGNQPGGNQPGPGSTNSGATDGATSGQQSADTEAATPEAAPIATAATEEAAATDTGGAGGFPTD